MNRSELVKKLELIQPALATTNLVPVFSCFVFREKSITAYNDALGIVAKGGIDMEPFATPGATLLGLLQNSHAEEVEFSRKDDTVIVQTGRSNFKLPTLDLDETLFTEPKEKWGGTIGLNEDVLKGIVTCLTTSSRDQAQPAIMGVCINFDSKKFFSSDGDAITRYGVDTTMTGKGVYTIPNVFCDALLKITSETETTQGKLELNNDWVKVTLNNGFVLYGRMIVNETPIDHQLLIDQTLKGKWPFVPLPLGLNDALARARVLADRESAKTTLTVEDGKLKINTDTHMGVVKDETKIKSHPDVVAVVHASLVHRSIGICDQISIRENATAYKLDDTVLQVVGNVGE